MKGWGLLSWWVYLRGGTGCFRRTLSHRGGRMQLCRMVELQHCPFDHFANTVGLHSTGTISQYAMNTHTHCYSSLHILRTVPMKRFTVTVAKNRYMYKPKFFNTNHYFKLLIHAQYCILLILKHNNFKYTFNHSLRINSILFIGLQIGFPIWRGNNVYTYHCGDQAKYTCMGPCPPPRQKDIISRTFEVAV